MSMTIDGSSYICGTTQSTQAAATEQVEQTENEAEQAAIENQTALPRMDTVEISQEGRAASAKLQSQDSTTEEEAYEAEDLSQYLDYELKQMYYSGEITHQEYEEETGEKLE